MKTAAIVITDWKLPIFKKGLDRVGFSYTEHEGVTPTTRMLKVEVADVDVGKLAGLVKSISRDAANSKLH